MFDLRSESRLRSGCAMLYLSLYWKWPLSRLSSREPIDLNSEFLRGSILRDGVRDAPISVPERCSSVLDDSGVPRPASLALRKKEACLDLSE